MTGGQRHRGGPQPPHTHTHTTRTPCVSSLPSPRAPLTPHKRRRKRAHLERSRGAAGAGARGAAAASPAAAAGRGVAEKAPFSGAARACSPAAQQPLSACRPPPPQPPAPRLDTHRLGFPLGHRRGVARGGRPWTLRLRRGRRTDTRSKEAGGPESPAWGRSEAVAGGGGGGGVDSTAAAGLGTTFYIWPLVWGPRGRRGRRRETLGGGPVAAGSRPPGWRRTGPRRTMHLGVKPRLRVSGPRPRPLCLPATVEDRATKAKPPGPACPRGPSPAGLFRIRARRRRGGEGWC